MRWQNLVILEYGYYNINLLGRCLTANLPNRGKHELLNNLFNHPYTKIEFVERDMMVSRQTASKYLDMITQTGLLQKIKMGKENYYINTKLVDLFINQSGEHKSNDIT